MVRYLPDDFFVSDVTRKVSDGVAAQFLTELWRRPATVAAVSRFLFCVRCGHRPSPVCAKYVPPQFVKKKGAKLSAKSPFIWWEFPGKTTGRIAHNARFQTKEARPQNRYPFTEFPLFQNPGGQRHWLVHIVYTWCLNANYLQSNSHYLLSR